MNSSGNAFKRTIGLHTATSIVIGSIIGSGIFMRPAEMASLLGSPALIFLVWVIAGLVTYAAAMISAEMGSMLPETGGQYMFMSVMYGDFWSYLFGWANFAVINTAGTAGIAFICAQYLEYFFPLPHFSLAVEQSWHIHLPMIGNIFPLENIGLKMATILLLGILTTISYVSTKLGGAVQVFITIVKVVAIGLLAIGLFVSGKGSFTHFTQNATMVKPAGFALLAALIAASNGALQAFDGWSNMLTVSGEVKDPGKTIPRSLFLGVTTCMLVYISITAAMIYILPVNEMAHSNLVASDAARVAFGTAGGGLIAILIMISVAGSTNASVLSPPRMTFAMARKGEFFAFAGNVHPRFKTPSNALWLHFAVMVIMVFSGSFYMLSDMYIFIAWVFNAMLIAGIFILRKKMPGTERPYKIPGYPWIPLILLAFNLLYLGLTLYSDITNYLEGKTRMMNSVFGLALTALGIPLHYYFRRKYSKQQVLTVENDEKFTS